MGDQEAIETYWQALARTDGDAMASCYSADASFRDPIFNLEGAQIGAMWRGLMNGKGDVVIETGPLAFNGSTAKGAWRATYTFGATGRTVVNNIRSSFEARDGRIVQQRDRFSFWRWSRMALGAPGWLLGWTPLVRNKVRRMASKRIASN